MPPDRPERRPSPGQGLQPENCTSGWPSCVAPHPLHLPSAFYLHVSLHTQCRVWITPKVVLSRCEVDGNVQGLIRQLKEVTCWKVRVAQKSFLWNTRMPSATGPTIQAVSASAATTIPVDPLKLQDRAIDPRTSRQSTLRWP